MRAALLLLLLPELSSAQPKEIQVSGHVGWGGLAASGDWTPALIDVDNRGDKDRDLILVLTWAFQGSSQQSATPSLGSLDGRTGPSHHLPVTVGARSRKRISVTTLASEQDRMSLWVYALPATGGRPLAFAELPLRPVEAGRRLVAVVGTDLPDGFPSDANEVGRILPEALPEDWRAYSGLDALVWLDGRPSEMRTQAQVDALRDWVSSGGRLVVARANDAGLPGSALAEILPVTPRGTVTLDALELFGKRLDGRVSVLDGTVKSGRVAVRQGAVPLVVDAPRDGGRVIFIGFDPSARPFAGSEHAAGFWTALLGKPAPVRQDAPGTARAPRILGAPGLAQVAGRFPDVEPPAIGWLFVLIIAYLIVVGPLDYFVLRAFRRLELTWITFPAYVVGFTLFILVAGGAFMGRAAYQREVAVIDHHESGFARHRALSAVLAPTDLVYSISDAEPISSNFTPRAMLQDFSDKLSETRILHDKVVVASGWVLNRSFTGLAASDRCSRAPSPVTWKLEGPAHARAQVTVTNNGPATYTQARLVTASGVFELGDLPPGTRTIDAGRIFETVSQLVQAEGGPAPDPSTYGYYTGNPGQISEPELNGQVRAQLVRLTFAPGEEATGFARTLDSRPWVASGGSVLIAWTQSGDPQVRFDPFPSRRSGLQMTRFYRGSEK